MSYILESDELELIKDLVRVLEDKYWVEDNEEHRLSVAEERALIELAHRINGELAFR